MIGLRGFVIGRIAAWAEAQSTGAIPKPYIARYLPADPIVVEAGAHVGRDTVEMSRLWPLGTINAFEPVPALYARLYTNTCRLANVRRFPVALAETTGSAPIHLSSGRTDGASSLLQPKAHLDDHPDVHFAADLEVQTITLDDWAESECIDHVDFLWLDMQGYELRALMAAPKILSTVRAIHSEVSLKEAYEGITLYPHFRAWLSAQGFRVAREELPWPDMGNVLFVRDRGDGR